MSGRSGHRGWGWIRKRSSGRYQASYLGPDRKRHFAPTTFASKMRAEAWLAAERREIEDAKEKLRGKQTQLIWASPSARLTAAMEFMANSETLQNYAQRAIDERTLKGKTRIHYQDLLDRFITPKLGEKNVGDLTPALIRSWYAKTLVDKPTMRAHAYGLLSSVCATAVKDGLLQSNPCQIKNALHAKTKHSAAVPEVGELAVIAEEIEGKFKAYVLISAWCGLRFGEVIELRRKDISDGFEIISVSRGMTHGGGRCMIDTPKSGKPRKVVVPRISVSISNTISIHSLIRVLRLCCSSRFAVATSPIG